MLGVISPLLKQKELLTAWKVLLRPITEYAAPLWHSGLTKCDSEKLERLQKRALGLILGTTYIDYVRYYNVKGGYATYEAALRYLEIPKLADRRESLTKTFAIDTFKNEIHEGFFEKNTISNRVQVLRSLSRQKLVELTDTRIPPFHICQDC